jgi:hypothetical protein
MSPDSVADWMMRNLLRDGCIYQEDVVDMLVKAGAGDCLKENADGNLVLTPSVLASFKNLSPTAVVWVRPERYWRWRVPEDEPGRDARG